MEIYRISERLELSKTYWMMAKRFSSGELGLGSFEQWNEDPKQLERQYRRLAAKTRRSAMLLRRVAFNA